MSELDLATEGRSNAVLLCLSQPEADLVADAVTRRGFGVAHATADALVARVTEMRPRALIVDVDDPRVAEAIAGLRRASTARILCIGDATSVTNVGLEDVTSFSPPIAPIDAEAIAASLGDVEIGSQRSAPIVEPRARETPTPRRAESDAPPSGPATSDPLDVAVILPIDDSEAPSALVPPELSPELLRILRAAEERVGAVAHELASGRSEADEPIDMLLPAELLAALDEPLEPDEDSSSSGASTGGTAFVQPKTGRESTTGARTGALGDPGTNADVAQRSATAAGVGPAATSSHDAAVAAPPQPSEPSQSSSSQWPAPFPSVAPASAFAATTADEALGRGPRQIALDAPRPPVRHEAPDPSAGPFSKPPPGPFSLGETPKPPPGPFSSGETPKPRAGAQLVAVLGEGDAVRALATSIASRASGSLALGPEGSIRRIVLHDGDIVTAASAAADETLIAFLVARGDIERDVAARLAPRLPAHGRHAGAALVAHGHLGQDDLWPTLRAHAEWVIGRALDADEGTCELEDEPPGRLKAEPNVFGGATGAEVLLEQIRRVVSPAVAVARLGGAGARIAEGPRRQLLAECALRAEDEQVIRAAPGRTVGELLDSDEPELAGVLLGLAALGVLEIVAPIARVRGAAAVADPLDDEALRQRVRARMALVEDGDYFALLGIARGATGYEVRRAYLELRRAFEPGRVLTAATADLAADVRLVAEVLDEAYEILREPHRRDRYRRAIEAGPR